MLKKQRRPDGLRRIFASQTARHVNPFQRLLGTLAAGVAFLTAAAQGGPDCATALLSPITLPFSATGLTNCGSGNDYDAGTSTTCGSILYVGGEDQLYAFTPTTSGLITVNVTSSSTFMGLFLFQGCPAGGTCISSAYSGAGNQTLMATVTAGVTYFIMVDSWPAPSCHPSYDLSISAPGPLPPPTTQDCFGAIPVCQDTYQELTSPVGEGNYPDEINDGISCLGGGEVDGLWYVFTVQTAGLVCFSITPNDLTDDYDWAVYDLTTASCADIFSGAATEVSCNFSGLPGVTGANGLAGSQNEPCIPVNAGETYALYVSNWSQSVNGYTLDFGAGSADIFDLSPPTIDSVLTVSCDHSTLTVQMSEFVLCSSVQPSDFAVSGPGGPYTVIAVNSALCGSGGAQDNVFELTISPPLADGAFTLDLVDFVEDLCGNLGNTGTLNFSVDPLLDLSVTATGAGCNGIPGQIDAVAIGGTAPFTFDLDGLVQINNGTYAGLVAGSYTLTLTDASGCSQDTVIDVLNATTTLENDSSVADASCNGANDGSIEVITTGTGGPWDYTWTDAGGTVVQTTTGSNGDTFTGSDGTYTVVIVEGPLGSGCSDTVIASIGEPPAILITASNDTLICLDGTATLSASTSGGTAPVDLTWDTGLTGNGPHNVSPATDQVYTVFGVDANGCHSDTLSIEVAVGDPLYVELPDTLSGCPGVGVPIAAGAQSGGDGAYQYDWGSGSAASPNTTSTLNSSAQICVTMTDGCETPPVSDCVWIEISPVPNVILTVDSTLGCEPFAVTFSVVDTTGSAVVEYQFGDGSAATGGASAGHAYTDPGIYSVTATVTWPNGCQSDTTIPGFVTVVQLPVADFTWSPNPTTTLASTIQFEQLASPDAVGYAWDFAGLDTSSEGNPIYTFPNLLGDEYPVTLLVANSLGCLDSITLTVVIRDEFLVFVPNSFTPDGDGLNDFFYVSGNDIDPEGYELEIFDRWGEVIWRSTDRYNVWGGAVMNRSDKVVKEEVYVWKLNCRSETTKQKEQLVGTVTLLR